MSESRLEFKIVKDVMGNDIDLNQLSLETSKSLKILLESLINIIGEAPNSENIRIKITKGSAVITAEGTDAQIDAIETEIESILNFDSTNSELVKNWKNVQSLFSKNGFQYEANFYKKDEKISLAPRIKNKKPFRTKYVRREPEFSLNFIYGKLISVGGKKPNIHVLCESNLTNDIIIVNCSLNEATKVNSLLYKDIYITSWKRAIDGNRIDETLCAHYLDKETYELFENFFVNNSGFEEPDTLVNLHEQMRSFIDKKDFGNLRKFLKIFNHDSIDVNPLKTILVTTKSFKEHERIKEIRDELKSLLDKKLADDTPF